MRGYESSQGTPFWRYEEDFFLLWFKTHFFVRIQNILLEEDSLFLFTARQQDFFEIAFLKQVLMQAMFC